MTRRSEPVSEARATRRVTVQRLSKGELDTATDLVTLEEPLEIRLVVEEAGRRRVHSVAVTMRTPGADIELAAGFLVSEGVVRCSRDLWKVEHCRTAGEAGDDNVVDVYLAPGVRFDLAELSRNVVTTSACGICGRTSIAAVRKICETLPESDLELSRATLSGLTRRLEQGQSVFASTGGLHAAALFDRRGGLTLLREDVGRHNAFDKMVGELLLSDCLPARQQIAMVSGRASFELVQKALLAGIPVLISVGAPSSLAIDLATEYGMTLIGFFRTDRFNLYCGFERWRGQ